MGAQQSKSSPDVMAAVAHEQAILERLQKFRSEDDFVYVENEKGPLFNGAISGRQSEKLAIELTQNWQSRVLADPKNRLALSAFSSANPRDVLASRATKIADQQVFNIRIPFEGAPITNQRSSGRCWLFASTNVFRIAIMKKYNLDSFELSQAYLFFWDKLEKSNFFLENIIETADQPLDGRLVQRLFADPISDGGQWDMVYNLVEKYGLVPQTLYPDSWNAMSSSTVNSIVVAKLREYAVILRDLVNSSATTAASLSATKDKMLREVHLILTLTLGPPPSTTEEFEWNFIDKEGRARSVISTPHKFANDISSQDFRITSSTIASMVSLVHDPRHEPLNLMTVDRLGNIVGGRGITYINVDIETLKQACISMLRAGLPVFFGSDVGKYSERGSGIMDIDLFDYELGFNVSLYGSLDKAARLRVGESAMTHAMVLTAVHVDGDGRPVRWKVQNSWGTDVGSKGWFVMSDRWMDQFVYQAVVDPKFLSRKVRDVLTKEPIVLPLWDPMGSLA